MTQKERIKVISKLHNKKKLSKKKQALLVKAVAGEVMLRLKRSRRGV